MGNQWAVKLADRLGGHLPPLPSGRRRVGRQGRSLLGPPPVSWGRGPSEVTLPPPGCAGAEAARSCCPFTRGHRSQGIPPPRQLPTRGQSPAGNKRPGPCGDHPSPTCRGGRVGCQLCSPPPRPPLRTAPSHGHLGPPEHGVGARLRRGAGLLAEETSPHLPLGTQEPATATPETRGSTRALRLTPGTSDLSCLEVTLVTPGPAQHPGYCRHPPTRHPRDERWLSAHLPRPAPAALGAPG